MFRSLISESYHVHMWYHHGFKVFRLASPIDSGQMSSLLLKEATVDTHPVHTALITAYPVARHHRPLWLVRGSVYLTFASSRFWRLSDLLSVPRYASLR